VSATTILRKQDLIPSQPHRVKNRPSDGQKKFSRRLISGAAFSLLLASFSINAATVPEYQKNVRTARELTIELRDYLDASENLDQIDAAYEKSRLAEIRRALPVSEKIEWQEATIETGNEWINAELTVYAGENNLPKRIEVLTAIGERLAALEEKLAELENPNISNRTKDEDKQKLAEILRREEYQKPEQKQESLVQKWWQQLLDWFADAFPKPKISENAASGAQSVSFVLQIILYAIVLGVIGFLIYRFAPIFLQNRRAREKSEKKDRVILGERVAANDSAATLFGEAEALARAGDLRSAIRKGYIALLCDLSDRRVISLAQHKTNRDYLRDVRPNPALYENISGLTGSFERHWYGSQNAVEEDWNEFRERYRKTVN
jgi:predicted transcriptional regulator